MKYAVRRTRHVGCELARLALPKPAREPLRMPRRRPAPNPIPTPTPRAAAPGARGPVRLRHGARVRAAATLRSALLVLAFVAVLPAAAQQVALVPGPAIALTLDDLPRPRTPPAERGPVVPAQVVGWRQEAKAYEYGDGVARDPVRAAELYCRAARYGDAESQYSLAWMLTNARGIERDDAQAAHLFAAAAEQGYAQAANILARMGTPRGAPPPCLRPPEEDPSRRRRLRPGRRRPVLQRRRRCRRHRRPTRRSRSCVSSTWWRPNTSCSRTSCWPSWPPSPTSTPTPSRRRTPTA